MITSFSWRACEKIEVGLIGGFRRARNQSSPPLLSRLTIGWSNVSQSRQGRRGRCCPNATGDIRTGAHQAIPGSGITDRQTAAGTYLPVGSTRKRLSMSGSCCFSGGTPSVAPGTGT